MTGVLMKRGNLNTEKMYIGRMPCKDKCRYWSYDPISQEMSNIAKKPEARRKTWNRSFLTALRRNQTCQHLDLGLLAPRTVRQYISAV